MACALILNGGLLISGGMGPQTFVLATLLTVLIFLPVLQQLGGSVALRFARDSEKALAGFLSKPDLGSGKTAKVPGNNAIRFENISFAYPGERRREALHNASFDIPIGGVTAIVGPSGAGKSTVLNLIARFYDPSFGAVKLGGIDLQDIPPHDLLAKMSIVLLDEASAAIDSINAAAIQEAIGELSRGKTFIVIAHHLSAIAQSDRIIVLGPVYTMLSVLLCPKLRQSRRAERSLVIPNERPACSRQASNAEWRSLGHNPKGLACFAPQLRCLPAAGRSVA